MRTCLLSFIVLAAFALSSCATQTKNRAETMASSATTGCIGGYEGDLTVTSPDDPSLKDFAQRGCTEIQGDLNLDGYSGTQWPSALSHLLIIGGSVHISDTALTSVSLSHVLTIGGRPNPKHPEGLVIVNNPQLDHIKEFTDLISLTGDLAIMSNMRLTAIGDFPEITLIGGTLAVSGNDSLADMGNFPKLTRLHQLIVHTNANLVSIGHFPALETISGLLVIGADPRLRTIGDFSSLQSVGQLVIRENKRLPACRAQHLAKQIVVIGDKAPDIQQNTGTGTCNDVARAE